MKSFPIIYQHDSMQCGIACLQMVCKYFGREYSSDSLSKFFLLQQKASPCSVSMKPQIL